MRDSPELSSMKATCASAVSLAGTIEQQHQESHIGDEHASCAPWSHHGAFSADGTEVGLCPHAGGAVCSKNIDDE